MSLRISSPSKKNRSFSNKDLTKKYAQPERRPMEISLNNPINKEMLMNATKTFMRQGKQITESPTKNKGSHLRGSQSAHKKQIQATLNELHRLQSQIYELNVPESLHSSPPAKKQIKQLAYLYENMTKPKQKNKLNIQMEDIQTTLQIINEGHNRAVMRKLAKGTVQQSRMRTEVEISTLAKLMRQIYQQEFDLSLLQETGEGKESLASAKQIYQFLNYNQYDSFDPLYESYELLLDEQRRFSFQKYAELNQILGLPRLQNEQVFKRALGIQGEESLSFEQYTRMMQQK